MRAGPSTGAQTARQALGLGRDGAGDVQDTRHSEQGARNTGRSARRIKPWALPLALAAALAACTIKPDVQDAPLPGAPEDAWTAPSAGAAPGQPITMNWLEDFASPRLDALITEALAYNTDLAQAAARVDAARASTRIARSGLFPTLDASANGSRSRVSTDFGGGPDTTGVSSLSWSLQSTWEADIWGRVRDGARAARADEAAFTEDLRDFRLSIAGAVANAWFTLIESHQQTLLAESDVENRERTLRLITRRFTSGLARSLDLRLARTDLASARARLSAAIQTEREAARSLEILLGRYPTSAMEYPDFLPALPILDGAGLPSDILLRRPDLRSAEARLLASGLRVREARRALLPRLTFTGSLGPESNTLGDLFDAEEIAGNLIGGLVQPLFQGGRLRANIAAARARAEEALYFYVDTALEAYREVENALDAETLLALQEFDLAEAAEEARASERLAERDYANGIVTIFDFLEAKTRRISAERSLLTIRRTRLSNRVLLYVALAAPFATAQTAPSRAPGPAPVSSVTGEL